MDLVKTDSRRMIDAQPSETAIGNMARRGHLSSICYLLSPRVMLSCWLLQAPLLSV